MITNQVYITTQYFFQKLSSLHMIVELRRHGDKEVDVAPFMMVTTSHRAEKTHRSDAKTRLQFWQMLFQYLYVLLRCLHPIIPFRLQK